MSYAHKLTTYRDSDWTTIVYCSVCGQDTNLAGPCPGEPVMTPKDDANFMAIFGAPVKVSKELEKIIKNSA